MTNEIETETNNTEALLEALIDQCREIIRDVVVPAAQDASDDMQRRLYINSAAELVRTGAAVGDTLARLRGGGSPEMRQRIVVERIEKSARLLDIPRAVEAVNRRRSPPADKKGEGGAHLRED